MKNKEKIDPSKWHAKEIQCFECKEMTTLVKIAFAADGEMLIIGKCPKCKRFLAVRTTWNQVIAECLQLDREGFTLHTGNEVIH